MYSDAYGNVAVMTGGGNAPGVGIPSGRNDDGFSGPINLGSVSYTHLDVYKSQVLA